MNIDLIKEAVEFSELQSKIFHNNLYLRLNFLFFFDKGTTLYLCQRIFFNDI